METQILACVVFVNFCVSYKIFNIYLYVAHYLLHNMCRLYLCSDEITIAILVFVN
jgi:hypothetical protein